MVYDLWVFVHNLILFIKQINKETKNWYPFLKAHIKDYLLHKTFLIILLSVWFSFLFKLTWYFICNSSGILHIESLNYISCKREFKSRSAFDGYMTLDSYLTFLGISFFNYKIALKKPPKTKTFLQGHFKESKINVLRALPMFDTYACFSPLRQSHKRLYVVWG